MATSALDVRKSHPPAEDFPARYRARVLAAFPGRVERIVLLVRGRVARRTTRAIGISRFSSIGSRRRATKIA
jgi:hypothetical protein